MPVRHFAATREADSPRGLAVTLAPKSAEDLSIPSPCTTHVLKVYSSTRQIYYSVTQAQDLARLIEAVSDAGGDKRCVRPQALTVLRVMQLAVSGIIVDLATHLTGGSEALGIPIVQILAGVA